MEQFRRFRFRQRDALDENLTAFVGAPNFHAGTEPLRRYHRLRKRVLGVDTYHTYDTTIPLVDFDRKYQYEDILEWLTRSVAPLGSDYQTHMHQGLAGGWIDVSAPIDPKTTPVYPGNTPVKLDFALNYDKGDKLALSRVTPRSSSRP